MIRLLLILFFLQTTSLAYQTLKFGVFISTDYKSTQQRYEPLITYLNQHLQNYHIQMVPLQRDEMDRWLQRNQIDIISTNPSHYEVIRNHNLLTRTIATTQNVEKGVITENLGGVIITSANNRMVHSLSDLNGKVIASMDEQSLGAYQAQIYECLQHGIDVKKNSKFLLFHNQNDIVQAVLSHKADVGFIRTGILETMLDRGIVELDKLRILNRQKMNSFPYITSTRLYPEWPIVIMPHIDEQLAKQLTILLLNYQPQRKKQNGIGGFTLPQNYASVAKLLASLKLSPYDHMDVISWKDIYRQYQYTIFGVILFALFILLALLKITNLNRKIRSNEERFSLAIDGTKDGLFDWNIVTNEMFHSKNYEIMLGYSGNELPQTISAWEDLLHPDDIQKAYKTIRSYIQSHGLNDYSSVFRMRTKNGLWKWIEGRGKILFNKQGKPTRFIGFNTDITEKKENEIKLEYAANHDLLTNLPNRTLLSNLMPKYLASAKRHKTHIALLFIDLDGFKNVNDTYGHDIGDLLLKEAALRMQTLLREEDLLSRLGGDEFTILISNLTERDEISYLLPRLLKIISEPYLIENNSLTVSASIGISFYPQGHEVDADTLLRQADQAMYKAKFNGKNQFHYFHDGTDNLNTQTHDYVSEIINAIENDTLILHYQPKVNMKTGKILGAEALVRWKHPEKGVLLPDSFISFIENNPAIYTLDIWVTNQMFQQITYFKTLDFGRNMRFSINLSAYSFKQQSLVDDIKKLLYRYPDVSPHNIEFEILESSALYNVQEVKKIVSKLHEIGITVSLDDFGTGYASMTYLKKLNVDYLKIDRSFVLDILTDSGDLRILEATIGLADAFQSSVIAEGVESQAHGDLLIQFGCYLGQGNAISPPMEPQTFLEWSRTWKPYLSWQQLSPIPQKLLPFLYATIDHRHWLTHFNMFVKGETATPPQQNHALWQFGAWLESSECKKMFTNTKEYEDLCAIEYKINDLSHHLAEQIKYGQTHIDTLAIEQLNSTHEQAIEYLQKIIKNLL